VKTLILVTGQHRSGTSATAGCLQRLGVELGGDLMPGNHANPKGYFEDMGTVEAHDALLKALGASWDRPWDVPEKESWHPGVAIAAETQLRIIVQAFAARSDLFAIKDPRAALFIPLWEHVCAREDVRLVVLTPTRLEEAVVQSLVQREGWDLWRAEKVVHGYSRALCQGVSKDTPWHSIHFPDNLWQASTWEKLARELDVELDVKGGMGKLYSFLDFGLVHHG
jgi:hypothetical protein